MRRRPSLAQFARHAHHRARAVDLWQQDRIGAGRRGGGQILLAPGRIDSVDANNHFPAAKSALAHGGRDLLARRRLGLGRNRVFKVEDDRIRRKAARLGDGARIGPGHVEDAAARTRNHDCLQI